MQENIFKSMNVSYPAGQEGQNTTLAKLPFYYRVKFVQYACIKLQEYVFGNLKPGYASSYSEMGDYFAYTI